MRGLAAVLLLTVSCAQRPPLLQLPGFEMVQVLPDGERPFTLNDMKGRPWVVDFIFTRCAGPCPILSARMAKLDKTLPPSYGLLTVSVDPQGDTPEALRAYARRFEASPERWVFIRGDAAQIYRMMYAAFRLPISTNPDAPPESRITHSTKLVLVDSAGWVRGYYDGLGQADAETLARDARRLTEVGS